MPDEMRCTATCDSAGRSRSAVATLRAEQMLLRQADEMVEASSGQLLLPLACYFSCCSTALLSIKGTPPAM